MADSGGEADADFPEARVHGLTTLPPFRDDLVDDQCRGGLHSGSR